MANSRNKDKKIMYLDRVIYMEDTNYKIGKIIEVSENKYRTSGSHIFRKI